MRRLSLVSISLVACVAAPVEEGACVAVTELCNGVDDDCDGFVDNNPSDGVLGFVDHDDDGTGNAQFPLRACELPDGYSRDDTDCDDDDRTLSRLEPWFPDHDHDGHGDADGQVLACSQPPDTSADAVDCDDRDADVWLDCDAPCRDCGPEIVQLREGVFPMAALGDVDGDGFGDLLIQEGGGLWAMNGPYAPTADEPPAKYRDVAGTNVVCAADFDGDGRIDVLTRDGDHYAYTPAPFHAAPVQVGFGPSSDHVSCGDLDGVPGAEAVFSSRSEGDAGCGPKPALTLIIGSAPWLDFIWADAFARADVDRCDPSVGYYAADLVADVTGDGRADLLLTRETRSATPDGQPDIQRDFVVAPGSPDGVWRVSDRALGASDDVAAIERVAPSVPYLTAARFVTRGLAVRGWGADLQPVFSYSDGSLGLTAFLVGDVFGDGVPDVVVLDRARATAVLYDDPAGDLTPMDPGHPIPWTFHHVVEVLSEDVDGDGRDDLIFAEDQPRGGVFVPGSSFLRP